MPNKLKTVQSKYTNPDSYISRLKYEITRLEGQNIQLRKEIGEVVNERNSLRTNALGQFWFEYDKGAEISVNLTVAAEMLDRINYGTTIIGVGELKEFTRSKSHNSATMIIKKIYVKK